MLTITTLAASAAGLAHSSGVWFGFGHSLGLGFALDQTRPGQARPGAIPNQTVQDSNADLELRAPSPEPPQSVPEPSNQESNSDLELLASCPDPVGLRPAGLPWLNPAGRNQPPVWALLSAIWKAPTFLFVWFVWVCWFLGFGLGLCFLRFGRI